MYVYSFSGSKIDLLNSVKTRGNPEKTKWVKPMMFERKRARIFVLSKMINEITMKTTEKRMSENNREETLVWLFSVCLFVVCLFF